MTKFGVILFAAVSFLLPCTVAADTLPEIVSIGFSGQSIQSFLKPFDHTLGTLTSVDVMITGDLSATALTQPNFVFDGTLDRPYVETDKPAPLSVYGSSKLEGERRVLETLPSALVIRTSALFGDIGSTIKGGSFPERIVARAMSGEPLRVVADQTVNPTYTGDLAPAAIALAESGLEGVVHLVAAGCAGWDEFARAVLEESHVRVPVTPVPSAEFNVSARRPLNGCIATIRVESLRPWRDGLREWAARRARA